MLRKVCSLLSVICIAFFSTGCGLFHQDPGLKHLKEKYPDYTFEYMDSAGNHSSYTVEGFDSWVTVRAVADGDDYVIYDNFHYVIYQDQIMECQAEILTEICSRLGVDDFNISVYGGEGWMRDGILTTRPVPPQSARDCNTEILSFEEFMSSPESNNHFIGVIYVEDASSIDRDEAVEIISDVLDDCGCVFSVVRVDFTDDYEEFEDTYNNRWCVYDYQLMLWGETDENGQLIYTWKEQ